MPGIIEILTILSVALNVVLLVDRLRKPKVGTLHIEETPVGSIRYSLDVEVPLADIPKHRRIVFEVETKGDVS